MAEAPRSTATRRHVQWSDVAVMTPGMGIAVAVSWVAFFRQLSSYGLEPAAMVHPARLAVYGTQFLLVSVLLFWLARGPLRSRSFGALAGSIVLAWVGEGIVLTLIGGNFVANELDPEIAWYYWLAATAGPLQPMVGIVGAWIGIRARPRAEKT